MGVLLATAAALLLAYRRTISGTAQTALAAGASAAGDAASAKRLQREAAARLNVLSSVLQNSPSADLSAKNLGDEGAAYVVEALAFNTTCVAANLANNGIGRVGIAQLCEVLPTCRLETLVLATNSVGDDGAELLGAKLSGNASLQALDLGSNGIGDAGAAALGEGLKLNTTLLKLDLRCVAWGGSRSWYGERAASTEFAHHPLAGRRHSHWAGAGGWLVPQHSARQVCPHPTPQTATCEPRLKPPSLSARACACTYPCACALMRGATLPAFLPNPLQW
jgi:hypothetical protein